ncbi:hypothetical protein [Frankia sp. AiPa1]|uniref:hypothetical protein n=1 Tax=Frankia sp. AiPa1 TaxID=573492 RepID=UPI00202AC8DB|nr:hypothetical protein [Frankia sp. AiPa1]MCL9758178.1 hypothetical protein [Frankia sp. AiPa1]
MEIGHTVIDAPLDCTDMYRVGGMPGGVCICPHYGYVFSGSIRAVYPNTDWPDEEAKAGEVYFFPAGHVLIYPGPADILELNPASALVSCMDAMQRAADRGVFNGQAEQENAPS